MNEVSAAVSQENKQPVKKVKRVISPRMRIVLIVVLGLFSLLLANGIYLSAITWTQYFTQEVYEDLFYQFMFLMHLVLGLLLILPVVVFGVVHMLAARKRRNRRAVRIGYALFAIALVVLASGILLTRSFGFDLKQPFARNLIYWLHFAGPLLAIWLYWLHRLVGPRIKWQVGRRIAVATAVVVGSMVMFQLQDPRDWNQAGPKEGAAYFEPSLARTSTGKFIPAKSLQNDEYCMKCHPGIYDNWFHSAHHFSSFNNPAYLYSVRETRRKMMEREGTIQPSRWCAGCHDPVPFFSGAFDSPDYDDVHDPTSQAGITCTVCHAITHVNSNRGNADYVIEEPIQYPFTYSENSILQGINGLLVKAKPSFHKKTYLKPLHKTAEFCSTCHKVHLPKELTAYKEFLRGQNHYDSYLLSGVSGHGAQSFYYPKKAETNCNNCHMPQVAADDFGARYSEVLGKMAVHDHFFPGANTALPWWRGEEDWVEYAQKLLMDVTRVDLFGVRKGESVEGKLTAPLGPEYPILKAGEWYVLESVIRTTKLGHHLTQGTVDSNELWLEIEVRSGDRLIGINGAMSARKEVDPWSHFVNVFMLDREGNRVERRNAEDIFVPLYNHQIPPGAGQTVHYRLRVPENVTQPLEVTLRLKYRKFNAAYLDFMNEVRRPGDHEFREQGEASNNLPVTVMAEDRVVLGVETSDGRMLGPGEKNRERKTPELWERWNDYGIGLLLTEDKKQLLQASEAFREVEKLGRSDGALNLARAQFAEGELDAATESLNRAANMLPTPPAWTLGWLGGAISRQQGYLEDALDSFRSVLEDDTEERRERDFDFSLDYRIRNLMAQTLLDLSDKAELKEQFEKSAELLSEAEMHFLEVLRTDSENVAAHANLKAIYQRKGEKDKSEFHGKLHLRYKMDDNAVDVAKPIAQRNYPAADAVANPPVIYMLQRIGAYGLPPEEQIEQPKQTWTTE